MEEVTGLKERQVKNDIATKTNGDQASCKRPSFQPRSAALLRQPNRAALRTLTGLLRPLLPVISAMTVTSCLVFAWRPSPDIVLQEMAKRLELLVKFGNKCCPVCAIGHKLERMFETLRQFMITS